MFGAWNRHLGRGALLVVAAGLAIAASVVPALSASAATGGLTITGIHTTPSTVSVGDQVRTEIGFTLTNGTPAGQTTRLTLPAALVSLPAGFDLRTADGSLVATAAISSATPAVITFTTTDYGRKHVDVHGTAFLQDDFDAALAPPGRSTELTYVTGGRTFGDVLTVAPGGLIDRTAAFVFGQFVRSDQGHRQDKGALYWFIESPVAPQGGWSAVEFKDPMADGGSVDCSAVIVSVGDSSGPGNGFAAGIGYGDYSFVGGCKDSGLDLVTGFVPAGKIIRVQFAADLPAPTGSTRTTFENGATVSATTEVDGGSTTYPAAGRLVQSAAGGTAIGSALVPTAAVAASSGVPRTSRADASATTATVTKTLSPTSGGPPAAGSSAVSEALTRTAATSALTGNRFPVEVGAAVLLLFAAVLLVRRTRRRSGRR